MSSPRKERGFADQLRTARTDPVHKPGRQARISALLIDHDFWQAVEDLQQRKVIDKQYSRFLGDFPGLTAGLWAQQILNEVVVPYFDAQQ